MNKLATQVIENLAKVKSLDGEIETIRQATNQERSRIHYDIYREKIRELEHERDQMIEAVEVDSQGQINDRQAIIENLQTVIRYVNRILDFLRLDTTTDLSIADDDIKPYDRYNHRLKESLGYFFNDDYLKVKLFIIENDKPKNKYSLGALGKCLFYEDLLKLPRSYGLPCYTNGFYDLATVIKDFPSVAEAKNWLGKNKTRLNSLLGNYDQVKKEYQDAIQNYKVDDFQELLIAHCQCGYYYTEFERHHLYFRDNTVECPRCKSILTIKREGVMNLEEQKLEAERKAIDALG